MPWDIAIQQAKIAQQEHRIWQSFIRKHNYRILAINEDKIEIERMHGGQNEPLTRSDVNRAIERLKRGPVPWRQLMGGNVAKERALVELHPNVSWDEHTDKISWSDRP